MVDFPFGHSLVTFFENLLGICHKGKCSLIDGEYFPLGHSLVTFL